MYRSIAALSICASLVLCLGAHSGGAGPDRHDLVSPSRAAVAAPVRSGTPPTRKAIDSVERTPAPTAVPEGLRDEPRRDGFVEAWLFESDGRFALKTLALPQRDA